MSAGTLVLDGVTYDVTPRAVTAPPPPPPPPSGRRRIVWHHGWSGPKLSAWPVDVRASVTTVVLAMAQSAAPGTGRLTLPPGVTRQQVLALVATGIDVQIGVGGADDGGIAVTTSAQAAQAVASLLDARDALGVTGACWDLEGAPGSGWTPEAVTDASRQLVAEGMRVGIWSALYGGRLAGWGQVARALGPSLDHWQRGFYDFGEAADARLTGVVTGDLARMRGYLARDDQLVASFAPIGSTSHTPIPVMSAAYTAARSAYSQAGWSVWEDKQDSATGWTSTRALAAL